MSNMAVNVEIVGLKDLISDFKKAGGDAEPLVTAALANSTQHVTENVRAGAPHAFGTLQRSVLPEVRYPVGEVVVNEPYGRDVEEGTGPHAVPHEAIERWAQKKGIPKGISYAIVNSIKKKGTRAQPFFKPGWEKSQAYIEEQFDKVTERLIAVLAGGR
jgi:hypothetical protein